jgi:hypothetical protein
MTDAQNRTKQGNTDAVERALSHLVEPQPKPIANEHSREVWPLVVADLRAGHYKIAGYRFGTVLGADALADLGEARDLFGRSKYGVALSTENGRNPLVDALQELLDAIVYTRQAYEEASGPLKSACWHVHQTSIRACLELLAVMHNAGIL